MCVAADMIKVCQVVILVHLFIYTLPHTAKIKLNHSNDRVRGPQARMVADGVSDCDDALFAFSRQSVNGMCDHHTRWGGC